MLSKEQIENNKQTFIELIKSIKRKFDKDKLIDWLTEKSDFFSAPASAKYHSNYEGGLCEHCLNVFYSLEALVNTFASDWKYEKSEDGTQGSETCIPRYDRDSIIIVGLLHDLSKANFYEKYFRNVKNEETNQWEKVEEYKTIDAHDRFIYGNHEETSEFMVRSFIPLTLEESIAILHHMGGTGHDSSQTDLSIIYSKYNLACLLHAADLCSTFCLEKK